MTDIPSTIARVKNYINTIDQVTPLIVFNITVLQIQGSNGFEFKGPSGSIKLPNQDKNLITIDSGSGTVSFNGPTSSAAT